METTDKIQTLPLLSTDREPARELPFDFYRDFFKRVLDVTLSLILLPFILPILAILMILVKIDSKGPAIYRSERVGKDGKKFFCLKIRTMFLDAHEKLSDILDQDEILKEEYEKFCKLKNDPRVTRAGRFLRKLSLDELPQIFNVLKGEMSLVGPRPAFEVEIPKYGFKLSQYISVKPGITGLWQVSGRNNTSFEKRVKLDTLYAKESNLLLDLKILVKTIPASITKRGAY
jgi:undecaprenyl-phosphate galactose phosphotransferase